MKQKNLNFWEIPLGMIFAIVVIGLIMCGCKSVEYVPVTQTHTVHDSIYFNQVIRDSIYSHDSIYIRDKGDTVLIEKWHTKYVESIKHDTTFVAKIDSIPVPYEVTKYVEKKLSKPQSVLMTIGMLAILSVIIALAFKLKKLLRL